MDTASHWQHLARVVSEALREAGVSQREAATQTGIPITTLVRRLTGRSPLKHDELAALASLAGTTVTSLVTEAERTAA